MSPELQSWIEQVRQSFGDLCFACGRKNDEGLHLDDWDWREGRATAVFRPRPVLSVTGTLNLRFLRPLYVTDTITAIGWVEERRGRRLRLSGRLEAGEEVAAEANGLYLVSSTVA